MSLPLLFIDGAAQAPFGVMMWLTWIMANLTHPP